MSWEAFSQTGLPFIFYLSPIILGYFAWQLWRDYIRAKYLSATKYVLLEIKIPKEVMKTPLAMELALNALHQTWDGDNFLKIWFWGQTRSWFSLELVSLGGEIHFYLWTQQFHRNQVEASFYAQYPGIEIVETEDYVHDVPYGLPGSDWKLWGAEFKLSKEDAYPIKTYVDYGLDKPVSDVEAQAALIDPITGLLEFLGTMGPGEQLWIQILVMAAKDRFRPKGSWFGHEGWKEQGQALVGKIMQRDKKKKGPEDEMSGLVVLSPGERKVVESIERSLTKPGFDCGLRAVYLSKSELYNPNRIVGTLGSFKQFNANDANGFKMALNTGHKYPWSFLWKWISEAELKTRMFRAYRLRSYFYPPYAAKPFVLSAEELATIYHFPGRVAMTPSLAKIESKRAEPPVNLPV